MSIRAVAKVLELGRDVKGTRRLVMIALADSMNDEGFAYPKRETIARKAGMPTDKKGLDRVTELLGSLEVDGFIVRYVNAWAGTMQQIPGDRRPNVYQFTDRVWTACGQPPTGPQKMGRRGPQKKGTRASRRLPWSQGHGSPKNGDQNGEPSVDPPPTPHSQTRPDAGGDGWDGLKTEALDAGCSARQWAALVTELTSDPTVRRPLAVAAKRVQDRRWPIVRAGVSRPHDCPACDGGWTNGPDGLVRCENIYESKTV